jgi:hypothetical protein
MYYIKTILKLEILQMLYIRVVKKSFVIMCGKLTLEGVGSEIIMLVATL